MPGSFNVSVPSSSSSSSQRCILFYCLCLAPISCDFGSINCMLNFIAPVYGEGSIEYLVFYEFHIGNLVSILVAIRSYFLQNPQALEVVGDG